MLELYHAPTTRSFRIKWLLTELELPYVERVLNFYNMDRHSLEYRRVNSIGSFPTMRDGGLVLTESGAIINHIIRAYGNGRFVPPPTGNGQALVDEWMYWSEGLFAVHQRIFWDHCAKPPGCIENPVPSVGLEAARQAIRYAGMLEDGLHDEGFIVGSDLTGADFMLSFPLFLGQFYGWFESYPRITSYIRRISSRTAFVDAVSDTMDFLNAMRSTPPEFPSFRTTERQAEQSGGTA